MRTLSYDIYVFTGLWLGLGLSWSHPYSQELTFGPVLLGEMGKRRAHAWAPTLMSKADRPPSNSLQCSGCSANSLGALHARRTFTFLYYRLAKYRTLQGAGLQPRTGQEITSQDQLPSCHCHCTVPVQLAPSSAFRCKWGVCVCLAPASGSLSLANARLGAGLLWAPSMSSNARFSRVEAH